MNIFADKGGKIIFAGDPPEYIDVIHSHLALELSKRCITCNWDKNEVLLSLDIIPSIKIINLETNKQTEEEILND